MGEEKARMKNVEIEARARNITHKVRCTECGSQNIEDSQADIAILLRKGLMDGAGYGATRMHFCIEEMQQTKKNIVNGLDRNPTLLERWARSGFIIEQICIIFKQLIREEIRAGKSDKEIYDKLEKDYGESILYAPRFDIQTAGIWLSPVIVAGAFVGIWAYRRYQERANVQLLASRLLRNIPLTRNERQAMLELLQPPPPKSKWWSWSG